MTRTLMELRTDYDREESRLVMEALEAHAWRLTIAAKALGITASRLERLIERYGLAEQYAKHAHPRGRPAKASA